MTKLEQINHHTRQLTVIRQFLYMMRNPDQLREYARPITNASVCSFEVCWQESPGSNNYHNTTTEGIGEWVLAAAMVKSMTLLLDAEVLCAAKIEEIRLSRKAELEAELAEISSIEDKMSLTNRPRI